MDLNLFQQSDAIEVRRVHNRGKGGRGVFARRRIETGEIIERVPVLLVPKAQVFPPDPSAQKPSRISWYVFDWIECRRDYVALALGYGSIYNHSETPNARHEMLPPDIIRFIAVRGIEPGEEIFINYRGGDGKHKELGFEVAPSASKSETADERR